jgi:hypothetical protein
MGLITKQAQRLMLIIPPTPCRMNREGEEERKEQKKIITEMLGQGR